MPRIVYFFGLPASGKNYLGESLQSYGFHFYDADEVMAKEYASNLLIFAFYPSSIILPSPGSA
jgi:dephospho-CoA kinase